MTAPDNRRIELIEALAAHAPSPHEKATIPDLCAEAEQLAFIEIELEAQWAMLEALAELNPWWLTVDRWPI